MSRLFAALVATALIGGCVPLSAPVETYAEMCDDSVTPDCGDNVIVIVEE